jgi:pilus assembly protein Flp/PilA
MLLFARIFPVERKFDGLTSCVILTGVGNSNFIKRAGSVTLSKILAFLRDESGASGADYALILAIVGAGVIIAAAGLKNAVVGVMNNAAGAGAKS